METDNKTIKKVDDGDGFSLKVKPEFILTERAGSLPPVVATAEENDGGDERQQQEEGDARESGKKKRNKKNRGQNKKRPRDARQDDSEKVCMAILRGDSCPYGDGCRFSHDLKGYMATRPTDIVEVEGGCPFYHKNGYCMYGAMCRVGSCHISKTGENMRKDIPQQAGGKKDEEREGGELVEKKTCKSAFSGVSDTVNSLPKDVQIQLRKKAYPFQCKRHFEDEEKNDRNNKEKKEKSPKADDNMNDKAAEQEATSNAAVAETSSSPTPLDMPLKTKKIVDFSNKVYVAPLTTVGNLPFRRIMKEFGADITCGEMALVPNLLQGQASEWALLKRHESEDVFGVQLAAAHADQYTRVSEVIEKYMDVDFVDLNLGCPLDLLCDKGAGAALMMRERKLKGALLGMSKTLSCSITVKMRTGWDMKNPIAHQLVPKIQSWEIDGLAAVMIHGRSRLQRYKLDANWDYISQVASSESQEKPTIPIIGNGDIFSYQEYEEKVLNHPTLSPTAMLGRGALIKPWLPTEIKEKKNWDISASERLDILKNFVRHGLEHWGSDQQGVNNTRRFLLEWLSFLHRYVPVGLLEVLPQKMNQRPPVHMMGRNDLETLFLSPLCSDWIKISEMLLGPVPDDFQFQPKHKANSFVENG